MYASLYSFATIDENGVIFVSGHINNNPSFWAFDLATGAQLWQYLPCCCCCCFDVVDVVIVVVGVIVCCYHLLLLLLLLLLAKPINSFLSLESKITSKQCRW